MPRRSPSLVLVHIVWATSQRRACLDPGLDAWITGIIGQKARELRCPMLAAGCAFDHVHVVVRLASSVSLGELVQRMKGVSSRVLTQESALGHGFAWQDGYWAESLRPADLDATVRYVRAQRMHHDAGHPDERWAQADG